MIEFLLLLAAPALRYADDPNRNYWRVHLLAYTLLVWVLDMILARTVWAWYFGWPKWGEVTISHTLERLCVSAHPRKLWCIAFGLNINHISPGHIKVLK